jgi:hypothetical protein
MKRHVFCDIRPLKVNGSFGENILSLSSRWKNRQGETSIKQIKEAETMEHMEAKCSSETSVLFQQTTRPYIAED